ncbi:MAG: hypothetical protein K6T75_01005 [Acetobacteraceae bacterium]|nr:hypothetical protein [Acetobacteraceae bacterium]
MDFSPIDRELAAAVERGVFPGAVVLVNRAGTVLGQWQGGRLETVWPREYASKEYVFPVPAWSERPAGR